MEKEEPSTKSSNRSVPVFDRFIDTVQYLKGYMDRRFPGVFDRGVSVHPHFPLQPRLAALSATRLPDPF